MGRSGAFGMLSWMSGVAVGVGTTAQSWGAVTMGAILMIASITLYRRHIMPNDC